MSSKISEILSGNGFQTTDDFPARRGTGNVKHTGQEIIDGVKADAELVSLIANEHLHTNKAILDQILEVPTNSVYLNPALTFLTTNETIISTSLYATKGNVVEMGESRYLTRIEVAVNPTVASSYKFVIAEVANDANFTILSILHNGTVYNLETGSQDFTYDIPNGILLESGKFYTMLIVRTDAGATGACEIVFPGTALWTDSSGIFIRTGTARYASDDPQVGDATISITTGAVKMNFTTVSTTLYGLVYGSIALQKVQSINAQVGTAYTLVLADAYKLVTLDNASPIALTIPTDVSVAFDIGTRIDLVQLGAGAVTIGGAGVTINSKGANKTINGQFVAVSLLKTAIDTWLLIGDLTT